MYLVSWYVCRGLLTTFVALFALPGKDKSVAYVESGIALSKPTAEGSGI